MEIFRQGIWLPAFNDHSLALTGVHSYVVFVETGIFLKFHWHPQRNKQVCHISTFHMCFWIMGPDPSSEHRISVHSLLELQGFQACHIPIRAWHVLPTVLRLLLLQDLNLGEGPVIHLVSTALDSSSLTSHPQKAAQTSMAGHRPKASLAWVLAVCQAVS